MPPVTAQAGGARLACQAAAQQPVGDMRLLAILTLAALTASGWNSPAARAQSSAVDKLYAQFGWELDAAMRQRMQDRVAAQPKGQHGRHEYSFDDLAIDRTAERARYARYQRTFGVPDE